MFYADNLNPLIWSGVTSHHDLVPTTLWALGLDVPAEFTGSVLGTRNVQTPSFAYLLRTDSLIITARRGDYRLHYNWGNGTKELYDLSVDPEEMNDIYNSKDPVVIAIWEDLEEEIMRLDPMVKLNGPIAAFP